MSDFPELSEALRQQRLAWPEGRVRMVVDTDTYNEIDDQFALAYALNSPEKLDIAAIYAAPFYNERSSGPGDGMRKSYTEILRLMAFMDRPVPDGYVFRGAESYLPDDGGPTSSPAAKDLIAKAHAQGDDPLYVVAVGALTNVASAILMDPSIIRSIVVLWLGGHALDQEDTEEFNLRQDTRAAHVVLDSGVPLVLFPCRGVISHLHTSVEELENLMQGHNPICDYLVDIVREFSQGQSPWSKVIWDIAPIAWLLNAEWLPTRLVPSPVLTDEMTWALDGSRHLIRYCSYVHRDGIFADMVTKLTAVKTDG